MSPAELAACVSRIAASMDEKRLESVLDKCRAIDGLAVECDEEAQTVGLEKAYENYGVRVVALADSLARFEVPALVKALRDERAKTKA